MIKKVNIAEIKPNEENPRFITDAKFKKLIKSIKAFPEMLETRPLVVDENMVVLGGNMRLKALKSAGVFEVPVHQVKGWTAEQKKEFIIKDNIGYGEWDWDIIANDWELDTLKDWGLDLPDFPELEPEAIEDDYEEPEDLQVDVVLGDLIEIGVHRLLCGDSTNINDVDKLLNSKTIDLLFTDPPYNVAFNGRSGDFDVIKNDKLSNEDFVKFITEFANIVHTLNIPIKYIWCNWKFYGLLQENFNFNACIVWAKNVFGLGRGYRHQHEFCLFEGKIDEGIKNESDLWEQKKDTNYLHPTQKPIELAARAFGNHKKAKNILDLFSGSGLSFIASEQMNRTCYGMELDPKYCQVIIDRMHKLDPTLEIKINGKQYKNL